MTVRGRLAVFAIAALLLAPAVWRVAVAMPAFGSPSTGYGPAINAVAPAARNVTNMVAAINFDIRGFDTLGEECMLLCAVTGAVVLLRGSRGEGLTDRAGHLAGRRTAPPSDATVLACRAGAATLLLFGLYVILHGTVTPGGGFQGGVIVASALLLVYLGEGYAGWRTVMRGPVLDAFEGGGAFVYAAAACFPLLLGRAALENVLPLGTWKDLYSGGLMVLVNAAVAISVAGSFSILFVEFLEETRAPESDDMPDETA